MPTVKQVRMSIDQTLDRWESAAAAFEHNIVATKDSIVDRIEEQKAKATEASTKLTDALERSKQLPSDLRDKIAGDIDHLKVQLALGKAEARGAIAKQNEEIRKAVRTIDNKLDQIDQEIDAEFEQAVTAWIQSDLELQQEFDLAVIRFDYEQDARRAQFEAKKQHMLDKVTEFRDDLERRSSQAMAKGQTFSDDMNAAFGQMQKAFRDLVT